MIRALTFSAALLTAGCASANDITSGYVPNPALTPGAVRTTDKASICARGGTKQYRLTTSAMKSQVYKNYHLTVRGGICASNDRYHCEVDHLIPLENGGADNIRNLWPQPYHGTWNARQKDELENVGHSFICSGQLSVKEVQAWFTGDWRAAYKTYVGGH